MRLSIVPAAAALAAATSASAQLAPAITVAPGDTLLTVNSEGRAFHAPDLAVFTAGVTTQATTAVAALADNSRAMAQVVTALTRAGIAERDIQTSNLSIGPVYSQPERFVRTAEPNLTPQEQVPQIVGYRANNDVSVRQRDLKKYGVVIDTLTAAGANRVNGPSFQLENGEPSLNEARLDAIKNARARAELYANALSLRIVRILSISEGPGFYNPQPITVTAARITAAPPPPPLQPGELQQTANVTVMYELASR